MGVEPTRSSDASWTGDNKMRSCQLGKAIRAPGIAAYLVGLHLEGDSYISLAIACIMCPVVLRDLGQGSVLFGSEREPA